MNGFKRYEEEIQEEFTKRIISHWIEAPRAPEKQEIILRLALQEVERRYEKYRVERIKIYNRVHSLFFSPSTLKRIELLSKFNEYGEYCQGLQEIIGYIKSKLEYPQNHMFDQYVQELSEIVYSSGKKEYTLQIFSSKNNSYGECTVGVSYGIRLIIGEETEWERCFVQMEDSALKSDIANFKRSVPLDLCKSIAQYFQESIRTYMRDTKSKIEYDYQVFPKEAYDVDIFT